MWLIAATNQQSSLVFVELGAAVLVLAFLSRVAIRFGFSAIPLYLLTGLAFGNGGVLPLRFGEEFVRVGSEVGVVLLMFMLGLEYTGEKLVSTLKTGYLAGAKDFVLNFFPGLAGGWLLNMPLTACLLLGGVTYISSSGVIAKILSDPSYEGDRCVNLVVTVLVLEDLAMAVYLPVMAVIVAGAGIFTGSVAVLGALATVSLAMFVAVRFGEKISGFVSHQSDEILLLSILGAVLLVSGAAQLLQVSAAVGAFLGGVAISGPLIRRTERLVAPLRDLFAATFFLFFGLQIDPSTLPPVLPVAFALAAVTAFTKVLTGLWASRKAGLGRQEGVRAGATLIARGEFSIVIAGLGAAIDPLLGPLSAAYVLMQAVLGPIVARLFRLRLKPTLPRVLT